MTAKRPRLEESGFRQSPVATAAAAKEKELLRTFCGAVHQLGFVDVRGSFYSSKSERLQQLLARIPSNSGSAAVIVDCSSLAAARAALERCRRNDMAKPRTRATRKVATPCSPASTAGSHMQVSVMVSSSSLQLPHGTKYVINYDFPKSVDDYLGRLPSSAESAQSDEHPTVVYSFIQEHELTLKSCQEVRALFQRVRNAVVLEPEFGGAAKAAELDAMLEQMETEQDDDEDGSMDDGETCDCIFCQACSMATLSYHTPMMALRSGPNPAAGVEVVRLHQSALEDLPRAAPLIAPRLPGHVGTVICLHCLNCHTPWDGWEHLFAMPELGTLRVVFLLADGCSWHDYADVGSIGSGGVPWMDILDVEAMNRSDQLLERLVDHEAELLGGRSERIVLMGTSQGGGQSLLRFLRSQKRLGGWLGTVCHAPTLPHTTRESDPLLAPGRPLINCDRPMRLMAGEEDSVFPAGLVLRDADRLRRIGGFQDLEVIVQPGMGHEGFREGCAPVLDKAEVSLSVAQTEVPELIYLRQNLPKMLTA
eukprot:TRINITY_DN15493_c0_g1_i1.p1 TRINITY_DN15493_c0_g1~~TRINITY_DN15493_c0_g1_i1.p1  ORF type:complete len:536 (+),score=95.35 TRINITY_DN15493_c0_g1_i1:1649-3256(+)